METLFYLQDSRGLTGNNVMFWRVNGCGYSTNLNECEVYTLEAAQRHHNSRNSDIPILKSAVDSFSILAVDCQVLPESNKHDPNDEYVVQINGLWNGNDIKFIDIANGTYEYNKAGIFDKLTCEDVFWNTDKYTVFSKSEIDKISRRTFQSDNIDIKKMIKGAGIKLHREKKERATTGKARGNCPECGKITWDYDPHENAYCGDHK